MLSRIIQILLELKVKPFTIEKGTNGLISRVAATKIIDGRTKKPRTATLEILKDFLSNEYKVSREWINLGTGEMFLKDGEDCYLEKQGVRFDFDELLEHFIENQQIYLGKSDQLRLAFVDNIVKNKDFYIGNSEYFRFFIKSLIEEGIEDRLNKLKELSNIANQKN